MSEIDGTNSELPDAPYDRELDEPAPVIPLHKPPRKIAWFQSDVTGEFYFRIKADNGETIAGSEGYRKKDDMFDTLDEYFDNWDVVENEV